MKCKWKRSRTRLSIGILTGLLLFAFSTMAVQAQVRLNCQFPYVLGAGKAKETLQPGERAYLLLSVENLESAKVTTPLQVELPSCLQPDEWEGPWQQQGNVWRTEVPLEEGFDQKFFWLGVKAAADAPQGPAAIYLEADGNRLSRQIAIASGEGAGASLEITDVNLPLDRDGHRDARKKSRAVVLRDREWDYWKNLLQGKGASNQEVEAIHPVTHAALTISNPRGVQGLGLVTLQLADVHTGNPLPGFFTPGTSGEEKEGGAMAGDEEGLHAMIALDGSGHQTLLLPIYADERKLRNGAYLLQAQIAMSDSETIVWRGPVEMVKQDARAAWVTLAAALLVMAAFIWGAFRLRPLLASMKTRWLATVALFGAAAFAVVSVPAILFGEVLHVLLGPFSFLVTGLFSGIVLYMLLAALAALIPRPGVLALALLVRILLGMLAFGQMSPISFLSFGMHALLLETFFYGAGLYRYLEQVKGGAPFQVRKAVEIAVACAVADGAATYVSLQAMCLLYRLFYAEWYIALLVGVNGLLYTAIGAWSGIRLGRKLIRVGGD